jgi:rhamnulose-1-phosphate aldolase
MKSSELPGRLSNILSEMADVAGMLWQRGWAERNAGNISVNITNLTDNAIEDLNDFPLHQFPVTYPALAEKSFLVSTSGSRMRELAREPLKNTVIIHLNESGNGYRTIVSGQENVTPTSELPTHLGIHQMLTEKGRKEKMVLHAHVTELIALTQIKDFCNEKELNRLFWSMHPENGMFLPDGIGFVPYTTPGTHEIAEKTIKALENHTVALWEKHGVFAVSETLNGAFDSIDMLAKAAQIFFLIRNSGYEPQGFTDKQLAVLKRLGKNFK